VLAAQKVALYFLIIVRNFILAFSYINNIFYISSLKQRVMAKAVDRLTAVYGLPDIRWFPAPFHDLLYASLFSNSKG
jgi:hypothetical protein